jgi:hypothetical protein
VQVLHWNIDPFTITDRETKAIARCVARGEYALAVRIVRPSARHRVSAKYLAYVLVVCRRCEPAADDAAR